MTINVNGYSTENSTANVSVNAATGSVERSVGTAKQNDRNEIFGGNLNLANKSIEQRRKEAQQQAWNVVKNAWENDRSVDDSVEARKKHYTEMERLNKEALDEITEIEKEMAAQKELYGVADDSKEQQDLELLKKEQDYKNKVSNKPLTKEEMDRLEEIHKNPLTEYQAWALEKNDRVGVLKEQMKDYERQMRDDTSDVRSIAGERLKSNPMLEAKQAADALMEAANEEIKGMLMQEAVDYVDEKMEEAEEKAEASKEEQKEKEEQREVLELKRAVQEALIVGTKEAAEKARKIERRQDAPDIEVQEMIDIVKGQEVSKDVGQSLDAIKSSMRVLEADLKGIKVNEEA